jgi:NADH-quinone oxidoreductase subunit L
VGMLTSLMTATYMFRLVFLTFWGERRHAPAGHGHAAPGHGHDDHGHDAHGHGDHLHDAPKPMAFALIALTVGSILAGYIGLPHALGGSNRLEKWLEPSLTAPHVVAAAGEAPAGEPAVAAEAAAEHGEEHGEAVGAGVELGLMGLSSVVALTGIGLAWFFFVSDPKRSESVAQSFSGLRTVLLNKYYVDEAYNAGVVQPIRVTSEQVLWKVVDVAGIDGAVNGTAESVGGLAELLRRIQTGSVRAYAASLLLGAVMVFGYYLWR